MNCPAGGICIYAHGCPGQCVKAGGDAVGRGAGLDEPAIRENERAAVLTVLRRHIHSSHFLRVKAAVEADAKTRLETKAAA